MFTGIGCLSVMRPKKMRSREQVRVDQYSIIFPSSPSVDHVFFPLGKDQILSRVCFFCLFTGPVDQALKY